MARMEMSVETILDKIQKRFPYITPLEEIKSQKQEIRVRCTRCEKQCELTRSVYSLMKGKYAAECDRMEEAGRKLAKRISEKHPHIELVSGFTGRREKTSLFRCDECGCEWIDIPYNVLTKARPCPNHKKAPHEEIEEQTFWPYDENPDLLDTFPPPGQKTSDKKREVMEQRIRENVPNLTLLTEYRTKKYPILVECQDCHRKYFEMAWSLLQKKSGCRYCGERPMSYDEFISKLHDVHPEIACLSSEDEFNADREHIRFKCLECGSEFTKPSFRILHDKHGCPQCAFIKGKREAFYAFMQENHPDFKRLSDYAKSDEHIVYECPEGHIVKRTPKDWRLIRPENACLKCSGRAGMDTPSFAAMVSQYNPNIELVSEFTGWNDNVTLHCTRCDGTWEQTAISVQQSDKKNAYGFTCRHCERWNTWTHEDFIAAVAETSPNFEIIGTYTKNNEKMLCRCKRCGHLIMIRPDQLHMGVDACMHCRGTKHSSKPELFLLYFLQTVLGMENVISTDKDAIGKELDIYIPSKSFAIEWNGWYWHHDKLDNDMDKWKLCDERGIELLAIYDGMHCDKWLDEMEDPEPRVPARGSEI